MTDKDSKENYEINNQNINSQNPENNSEKNNQINDNNSYDKTIETNNSSYNQIGNYQQNQYQNYPPQYQGINQLQLPVNQPYAQSNIPIIVPPPIQPLTEPIINPLNIPPGASYDAKLVGNPDNRPGNRYNGCMGFFIMVFLISLVCVICQLVTLLS